jgi:prepilin-type N-terminal cleavage/methylation domain-containing protein
MIFMQRKNHGFSFIEIIVVLMLIGILSAFILSKSMNSESETIGNREVIKNHITYSQLMAMKSNTVCGINFNGSTYSIFRNGSTSDKITLPNNTGTDFPIAAGLGTTTEIIYFNLWGAPYTDITVTSPRTTGAIGSLGIILTTDTGYVL